MGRYFVQCIRPSMYNLSNFDVQVSINRLRCGGTQNSGSGYSAVYNIHIIIS